MGTSYQVMDQGCEISFLGYGPGQKSQNLFPIYQSYFLVSPIYMIYREDDASQRVIYNVDIAYQNYKQHYYHNYVVKKTFSR